MSELSEVTILEEGGIKITNRRAIIGSKTYAMANIASVNMTVQDEKGGVIPIVLVLFGLMIGFFSVVSFLAVFNWLGVIGVGFSFIVIGLGVLVYMSSKPMYFVKIGSSSGEANVLQSYDKEQIARIVNAVNEAIIRR